MWRLRSLWNLSNLSINICHFKRALFQKVQFRTFKVKYKEIAKNHLQASQSFNKIVAQVVRRDYKTAQVAKCLHCHHGEWKPGDKMAIFTSAIMMMMRQHSNLEMLTILRVCKENRQTSPTSSRACSAIKFKWGSSKKKGCLVLPSVPVNCRSISSSLSRPGRHWQFKMIDMMINIYHNHNS